MRHFMMGLAGLAAALATAGCSTGHAENSGPPVARNFQVSGGFDKLEVAGPFDVKVSTGKNVAVSARGLSLIHI